MNTKASFETKIYFTIYFEGGGEKAGWELLAPLSVKYVREYLISYRTDRLAATNG